MPSQALVSQAWPLPHFSKVSRDPSVWTQLLPKEPMRPVGDRGTLGGRGYDPPAGPGATQPAGGGASPLNPGF